jgi:hypothetical protein
LKRGDEVAERRMFAKTIIDSDVFLDMPLSTQALYFHLSMRADDDGFINNPKKIQRIIGASDDDLKLLIAKNFIIPFESGIVVIKHWKIHNYIRNDRYKETVYQEEKALLDTKGNKAYTLGIPNDNQMDTQVRLGKDRIGKDRIDICTHAREDEIQPLQFDVEKVWKDTYKVYPKQSYSNSAKIAWLDLFKGIATDNQLNVAKMIVYAIQLYLDDYKKQNPDDETFRYVPRFDTWLKEDCMYWIGVYEEKVRDK